ncbi:pseudouridine synthase [Paraliomyxa miuraensis]|uniref:pseudouridine synthase n=1 Tax=Paraliomyxa miuraensis TaxID=376150 RepID=UPI00224D8C71|nr:pseudouridine synthase [Paraliomyxa miuraensis]MCX4241708.1 pseudouridine synthase [Paraliomyxa miuraensis]
MGRPLRFRVVDSEDGSLLPQLLARRVPELSLTDAKELVRGGAVYLGHLRVRLPTMRVASGERVTVHLEGLEARPLSSELVRFVHRDPDFVVLDKPPGVPVAQTRQTARGTLAEALRRTLVDEGVVRPYVGVVHRLDQGASGLVMFTVRSVANKSVHRQFAEHRIERRYRVRVVGEPPAVLRCEAPLCELPHGRVRVAQSGEPRARPAVTELRRVEPVLGEVEGRAAALLDASLETGRTHQIRVHCQSEGFAVLGDRKYGERPPASEPDDRGEGGSEPSRLFLHAYRLGFAHPTTGERVDLRAPLPDWARAREDE